MEKIKEYKGIIILALVVLAGAFYWYEWRPSQIRKECFNMFSESGTSFDEGLYKNCLTGVFGLEK